MLPVFVDGVAAAGDRRVVEAHLVTCAACRTLAEAQSSARGVLHARRSRLSVQAPPGLRTRIVAAARDDRWQEVPRLGWRGRLSAFAAAALVVMAAGTAATVVFTPRSSVLLAAQLALDHIKCFVIDGDAGVEPISAAQAEVTIASEYGWRFAVADTSAAEGLALVAVRRCLYGDGFAAHLLYRLDGEPVSLFVMPGIERPADELRVLGHDERVWNDGAKTYMLVSRTVGQARLATVAAHLRNEAK